MKKVFSITNKYIVLATPLILYTLLTSIYVAISFNGKIINMLISLIVFGLMTVTFVAGWFNMIKLAIVDSESENPNLLMKFFPSGVGEYFLSALGAMINVLFLTIVALVCSYYIGMAVVGDPNISAEALTKAFESTEALKSFLVALTPEQLSKLNQWNLVLLCAMTIYYFVLMFYMPALFLKNKNPYRAFFISSRDLFSRKFLLNLGIYTLIFVINFIIAMLTALFANNSIMHFIMTLINFYFVTLVAVGVFYYYNNNFVKPQIGQNVDMRV